MSCPHFIVPLCHARHVLLIDYLNARAYNVMTQCHAMAAPTMPFHVYDCHFCNKTMLKLIFLPVKALRLFYNIILYKRGRFYGKSQTIVL